MTKLFTFVKKCNIMFAQRKGENRMKKLSSKILLIVMAVILILSLNATVNATAEDMAVL